MADIIERLEQARGDFWSHTRTEVIGLAIDEIERLRAEAQYWKNLVPHQIVRDFPFRDVQKESADG